jgi:hypothetical protein
MFCSSCARNRMDKGDLVCLDNRWRKGLSGWVVPVFGMGRYMLGVFLNCTGAVGGGVAAAVVVGDVLGDGCEGQTGQLLLEFGGECCGCCSVSTGGMRGSVLAAVSRAGLLLFLGLCLCWESSLRPHQSCSSSPEC